MDLVVKEENYRVKVGAEVYTLEYPSFKEAMDISKDFKNAENDGEKSVKLMKEWLVKLGLDKKFFDLKPIKSHHIVKIWTDVNTVKK